MKERKKTTRYLQKCTADVGQSFCVPSSVPCFCTFSGSFLTDTRGKSFCKTSFLLGMGLRKGQKQGRDERTEDDYLTAAKIHSRCRVFFAFFHLPFLYILYSGPSVNEMKFYRNFFAQFLSFFRGFLNHLPKKRQTHLFCWRRTFLAQGTNAFCASDECFKCWRRMC